MPMSDTGRRIRARRHIMAAIRSKLATLSLRSGRSTRKPASSRTLKLRLSHGFDISDEPVGSDAVARLDADNPNQTGVRTAQVD